MTAIIQPWVKVADTEEWIVTREMEVSENGQMRTLKPGDSLPKHLFTDWGLWSLYSTRKIEPKAAKPKAPVPPPIPSPQQPNDYPDIQQHESKSKRIPRGHRAA